MAQDQFREIARKSESFCPELSHNFNNTLEATMFMEPALKPFLLIKFPTVFLVPCLIVALTTYSALNL